MHEPLYVTTGSERFDPFHDGFTQDPYPYYSEWRRADAMHWGAPPEPSGEGCWYILSYQIAASAIADDRLGLEPIGPDPVPIPSQHRPFIDMVRRWMIFRDPPYHTRLRKILAPAFTQSALERLTSEITKISRDLVEQLGRDGNADLISELAFPLPVMTIARMMGISSYDLPQLKGWSRALLAGIDLKSSTDAELAYSRACAATRELTDYLVHQLAARRRCPTDDLLGMLAASGCSEEEAVANCALLLFAGHETTVNLIGNGLLALMRNPAQLELLLDDFDVLPGAIEELARYDSPAQMTFRFANQTFELAGHTVRQGDPVAIVIGSANRDERQFDGPDVLDVRRSPNRHLSFGAGRHMCLGVKLARLQVRSALTELLRSCPHLTHSEEDLQWSASIGLRGLGRLPVRLSGPRTAVPDRGIES